MREKSTMKFGYWVVLSCLLTSAAFAAAEEDRYSWLEDVTSERSLAWVKQQNARTAAGIAATPAFRTLQAQIRATLDSDARIPRVWKMGPHYYNFWKDAKHASGILRRTSPSEYRKAAPAWEPILDLDALNRSERENWVWRGIDCLLPEYRRCLIELSRGGADATVTREFDLQSRSWVKNGFFRPEAKGRLSWIDIDTTYLATDFGPGSTTVSGYPRFAKRWQRGTPMTEATLVYEVAASEYSVVAARDFTPGFEHDLVVRLRDNRDFEYFLRNPDGGLRRIEVPTFSEMYRQREWLLFQLREPWQAGGRSFKAGSLLATNFEDFMAGKRRIEVLFEPTDNTSLLEFAMTRSHVVINVLEDVKSRLYVVTPSAGGWKRSSLTGVPGIGSVHVSAVDANDSDAVWLTTMGFLTPPTLSLVEIGKDPQPLKSLPPLFDSSRDVVEQHFAVSKDGTRIPYFLIRAKDLKFDGSTPTLIHGYGGFESSLTPVYSPMVGKGWLEKGGVYVIPNLRGGGEYGPRWHQAALKEKRHKSYEDCAAVAQDLIARKITSAKHLGVRGASNGGLLAGNMLTQYPDLFGAVIAEVPLMDMKRYSHLLAGPLWMAEFGDPDQPEDWAFLRTFSPYHLFDAARRYPPVLIMTSTRDDRVHPGHARKMAARMLDAGKDVTYYENTEGGHDNATNNEQVAYLSALAFNFLWERLQPN